MPFLTNTSCYGKRHWLTRCLLRLHSDGLRLITLTPVTSPVDQSKIVDHSGPCSQIQGRLWFVLAFLRLLCGHNSRKIIFPAHLTLKVTDFSFSRLFQCGYGQNDMPRMRASTGDKPKKPCAQKHLPHRTS